MGWMSLWTHDRWSAGRGPWEGRSMRVPTVAFACLLAAALASSASAATPTFGTADSDRPFGGPSGPAGREPGVGDARRRRTRATSSQPRTRRRGPARHRRDRRSTSTVTSAHLAARCRSATDALNAAFADVTQDGLDDIRGLRHGRARTLALGAAPTASAIGRSAAGAWRADRHRTTVARRRRRARCWRPATSTSTVTWTSLVTDDVAPASSTCSRPIDADWSERTSGVRCTPVRWPIGEAIDDIVVGDFEGDSAPRRSR